MNPLPRTDEGADEDIDVTLQDVLVQTSFAVVSAVTEVATQYDSSLTQARLLAILRDHTPTMSELARHLGLDRSSVTGLVNRAADRGLVQRVGNTGDKRSSHVTLTATGRRMADAGAEDVAAQLAPLVSRLTTTERVRLARLLSRLTQS